MRILHMSDFHFGTEVPELPNALVAQIKNTSPDLAVVSGDFTQIGSAEEFKAAREFLDSLDVPYLCVPGNHDIPRYDLVQRFCDPFRNYRSFISPDISFLHERGNVCIAGINTARPILPHWNWANGAVSERQLEWLEDVYSSHSSSVKVCVMHHPVHKAEGNPLKTVVFGGEKALRRMQKMKIDLVLTGHVHHASITTAEEDGHKTVFLSASTAISRRLRGETNGFNFISLSKEGFEVEIFSHFEKIFQCREKFQHKFQF